LKAAEIGGIEALGLEFHRVGVERPAESPRFIEIVKLS
jgi:hypothetical protein